MPRWMRIIRGMIGTGLTFAVGVGTVGAAVGLVALLLGRLSPLDLVAIVGRFLVIPAFLLGILFSGILAISAHGRAFDRLSLGFVTALGAGGGLLYFLFIATNGVGVWSPAVAIVNLTFLTVMGAGSAACTLMLARRAGHALRSGEDMRSVGESGSVSESGIEAPIVRRVHAR